jgi:starvation-inducible DNA-binding protein
MNRSPTALAADARAAVSHTLQDRLVDAIDLHSQVRVAHWNVKGAHFPSYHPLFDTFVGELSEQIDLIAERAVTLGAHVHATVRHVAAHSRLPEYGVDTRRDLDHVRLLADRFELFLVECRTSRDLCEHYGDTDSADLFTNLVRTFERHAWFLRATLETA